MSKATEYARSVIGGQDIASYALQRCAAWIERYVAAEHVCTPPHENAVWLMRPSDDRTGTGTGEGYVCPECQLHWVTVVGGPPSQGAATGIAGS